MKIHPILISLILFFPSKSSFLLADDALKQRVLTEGVDNWKKLDGKLRNYGLDIEMLENSGASSPRISIITFHRMNEQIMLDKTTQNPNSRRIHAVNSNYAFIIGKTNPNDEIWEMGKYFPNDGTEEVKKVSSYWQQAILSQPWLGIDTSTIIELFDDPQFELINCYQNVDSPHLINIKFSRKRQPDENSAYPYAIQSGTLVVDPSRLWIIVAYEIENLYKGDSETATETCRRVFGDFMQGIPAPTESSVSVEFQGVNVQKMRLQFHNFNLDSSISSMFHLSGYGIKEPPEFNQKAIFAWYYVFGFIIVAVVCFGLVKRYRSFH